MLSPVSSAVEMLYDVPTRNTEAKKLEKSNWIASEGAFEGFCVRRTKGSIRAGTLAIAEIRELMFVLLIVSEESY